MQVCGKIHSYQVQSITLITFIYILCKKIRYILSFSYTCCWWPWGPGGAYMRGGCIIGWGGTCCCCCCCCWNVCIMAACCCSFCCCWALACCCCCCCCITSAVFGWPAETCKHTAKNDFDFDFDFKRLLLKLFQ